ncbi:MAG: hypothetical protein K6B67_08165 [Lachnospiraceae bacterium]|nr:hypothetical protein [Lachnospiraceae bacterium]
MRKSRMKFISLSLLSAITITGIIPSAAIAEELLVNVPTETTVEAKEVSAPTSVEGLEEVLEEENVEKSEFDSKSLIVNSKTEITFTNELIKTVTRYDEYYILTFETAEDTKAVYDELTNSVKK